MSAIEPRTTRIDAREMRAMKALFRLACALSRESGDVYAGRVALEPFGTRLEAWAREVDCGSAPEIPPNARLEADSAATALGGRLEVIPIPAERRIVCRIDLLPATFGASPETPRRS